MMRLGLGGDTATGVGDLDAEGLGLGDDLDALARGDSGGDPIRSLVSRAIRGLPWSSKRAGDALSSVSAVVHEQKLNVLGVVDEESLVAGGHHVLGLLVGTVTDLLNVLARGISEKFLKSEDRVRYSIRESDR
jgi:hypothetical protein